LHVKSKYVYNYKKSKSQKTTESTTLNTKRPDYLTAIDSISISAPSGRPFTAKAALAGCFSL
jgi:hypothetical protein